MAKHIFAGLHGMGSTFLYEATKAVLPAINDAAYTVGFLAAIAQPVGANAGFIFGDFDGGGTQVPSGNGWGFTQTNTTGNIASYFGATAVPAQQDVGRGFPDPGFPAGAYGANEQDILTAYYNQQNAGSLLSAPNSPMGISPRDHQMVLMLRVRDSGPGINQTYINGQARSRSGGATGYVASAAPTRIGASPTAAAITSDMNIIFCGAFIHNSALSDTEIKSLFLAAQHAKDLPARFSTRWAPAGADGLVTLDRCWSVKRTNNGGATGTPQAQWASEGALPPTNMTLANDLGPVTGPNPGLFKSLDVPWMAL